MRKGREERGTSVFRARLVLSQSAASKLPPCGPDQSSRMHMPNSRPGGTGTSQVTRRVPVLLEQEQAEEKRPPPPPASWRARDGRRLGGRGGGGRSDPTPTPPNLSVRFEKTTCNPNTHTAASPTTLAARLPRPARRALVLFLYNTETAFSHGCCCVGAASSTVGSLSGDDGPRKTDAPSS